MCKQWQPLLFTFLLINSYIYPQLFSVITHNTLILGPYSFDFKKRYGNYLGVLGFTIKERETFSELFKLL